jgi:hypothetical protein
MVGFQFRIFMYSDNVQIKESIWSQAFRRCPWRVIAKSKTKQPVPVQQSGWAFEGVRTLLNVQQITMRTSGRQSNTVRTLGQLVFNKELDFRSWHCLGSLCKPSRRRGNTSGRCPVFQNISKFRSSAERILAKNRPNARSSRSDVNLIKIELRCF